MRNMLAMLRAHAPRQAPQQQGGRERASSLQHQKQAGNSKCGLSSCRESHRQKEARRKEFLSCRRWGGRFFCKGPFLHKPPFRHRLRVTKDRLKKHCSTNWLQPPMLQREQGGREEGRKKERKEEKEERVTEPTGKSRFDYAFYSLV